MIEITITVLKVVVDFDVEQFTSPGYNVLKIKLSYRSEIDVRLFVDVTSFLNKFMIFVSFLFTRMTLFLFFLSSNEMITIAHVKKCLSPD